MRLDTVLGLYSVCSDGFADGFPEPPLHVACVSVELDLFVLQPAGTELRNTI
jgi:hypothetical protein